MNRVITLSLLIAMLIVSTALAGAPRFTRNTSTTGRPMVTDNVTGLVWQGCAQGLSGDDCKKGNAAVQPWVDALAYCENLELGGYTDWYLPNKRELRSIVDNSKVNPSIDVDAFPATPPYGFWSSSSFSSVYISSSSHIWSVYFYSGQVEKNPKVGNICTRCVRRGP
jgi:Protein of unknown function (DUF1566)